MHTFHAALEATTLLDRFAISGVIASWWGASLPDLKALATIGYQGLVEAWVATVLDALEEEKAKVNPLDHKVARALLPEYLEDLADLQAEVAELDSTIKEATATASGEDEDEETDEAALSPAELKDLKSKLAAAKRKTQGREGGLRNAGWSTQADALDHDAARDGRPRCAEAATCSPRPTIGSTAPRSVVRSVETWWDKYRVPLSRA